MRHAHEANQGCGTTKESLMPEKKSIIVTLFSAKLELAKETNPKVGDVF